MAWPSSWRTTQPKTRAIKTRPKRIDQMPPSPHWNATQPTTNKKVGWTLMSIPLIWPTLNECSIAERTTPDVSRDPAPHRERPRHAAVLRAIADRIDDPDRRQGGQIIGPDRARGAALGR